MGGMNRVLYVGLAFCAVLYATVAIGGACMGAFMPQCLGWTRVCRGWAGKDWGSASCNTAGRFSQDAMAGCRLHAELRCTLALLIRRLCAVWQPHRGALGPQVTELGIVVGLMLLA